MSLIKFKGANLITNGDFEVWSAGDNAAPDGWGLSGAGAGVSKSWMTGDPNTPPSYGAAIARAGTNATLRQYIPNHTYFQGKTISFGCWAKATTANQAALGLYDGVGAVQGAYHTGGAGWEWLTVTLVINPAATSALSVELRVRDFDGTAYFDVAVADHTLNFTRNPVYGGLAAPYGFRQPRDLSDGGVFYSYDKGVLEEFIELKWQGLPLADWTALDSFIRTEAEGAKNAFTYIDQDGAEHTVRLETTSVDFREVRFQRYAGSLILRKVA